MGTWGAGIFDDDVAMDVRDDFEEAVQDGASVAQATERIREDYADSLDDSDDGPTVLLALAALQIDHGALQPEVRDEALTLINEGQALDRWEEAGEESFSERKQVLEELGRRLEAAPQSGPEM